MKCIEDMTNQELREAAQRHQEIFAEFGADFEGFEGCNPFAQEMDKRANAQHLANVLEEIKIQNERLSVKKETPQ